MVEGRDFDCVFLAGPLPFPAGGRLILASGFGLCHRFLPSFSKGYRQIAASVPRHLIILLNCDNYDRPS